MFCFEQAFPIEASLDNLNVDPMTGDLWVAAQNSIAEFIPHEKNHLMPCGSRVSALLIFIPKEG